MMPNNVWSLRPLPAPYEAPRTVPRFDKAHGMVDYHLGGRALSDASQGLKFLWQAFIDANGDIWDSISGTPPVRRLSGTNAVWLALAFDQSSNDFLAYVDKNGNGFYYWFDSTIPGYRTSQLPGSGYSRIFAALDDIRVSQLSSSDVVMVYPRAGVVYARQQRDRFGVEYTLGPAPATLVQFGMNTQYRMQFQFQGVQKQTGDVPPAEYQLNVGGVINGPQ